jgi:hypothetical protein
MASLENESWAAEIQHMVYHSDYADWLRSLSNCSLIGMIEKLPIFTGTQLNEIFFQMDNLLESVIFSFHSCESKNFDWKIESKLAVSSLAKYDKKTSFSPEGLYQILTKNQTQ